MLCNDLGNVEIEMVSHGIEKDRGSVGCGSDLIKEGEFVRFQVKCWRGWFDCFF